METGYCMLTTGNYSCRACTMESAKHVKVRGMLLFIKRDRLDRSVLIIPKGTSLLKPKHLGCCKDKHNSIRPQQRFGFWLYDCPSFWRRGTKKKEICHNYDLSVWIYIIGGTKKNWVQSFWFLCLNPNCLDHAIVVTVVTVCLAMLSIGGVHQCTL